MSEDYLHLCGRIDNPKETEKILAATNMPYFGACSHAVGSNSGMGKKQLLYKFVEAILGHYVELVQQIGDCTSFSGIHGLIHLACAEIANGGESESFEGVLSTEYCYGVSRVLIGNGQLGNQDGSMGSWTVEGLKQYGSIKRAKYGNIDLSQYNPNTAKQWGSPRGGPPKELLNIGKEHRIKSYSLVESVEQAVDAIQNGYPVLFCSNQGFSNVRDKDGFLKPQGSWPHAMCGIAQDTEYKRPGICIQNSWPKGWVSGPKRHEQPDGSFWVDLDVIRSMIRGRDTFVISDYEGYPAKDLDWDLSKLMKERLKDYE